MRTTTADELRLLNARYSTTHLRVEVSDDGATWTDLTNLDGRDWVRSCRWGEDIDRPTATATVALQRERYKGSLNPFVDGRYADTVELWQQLRIYTATVPYLYPRPADADDRWQLMFDGRIEEVDAGNDDAVLELQCRDRFCELMTAFIEDQAVRADDGGTGFDDILDTMQEIIDAALGTPNDFTVNEPVTPGFNVNAYLQQPMNTGTALQRLTMLIGWTIRWEWRDAGPAFGLVHSGPDRSPGSTDDDIPGSWVRRFQRLRKSVRDIRNRVRIVYGLAGVRTLETVDDATSQTAFGIRFMQVAEPLTGSQLDTQPEAEDLADAIISDLAQPPAILGLQGMYRWPVQLGDYLGAPALLPWLEDATDFGLSGYEHVYPEISRRRGAPMTTLRLRGVPSAGTQIWVEVSAEPGVAPSPDFEAPAAPSGIVLTAEGPSGEQNIAAKFVAPTEPDYYVTKIYAVQGDIDFTPSTSNEQAKERSNPIRTGALGIAATVSVKLIHFDEKGNASAASAKQTIVLT